MVLKTFSFCKLYSKLSVEGMALKEEFEYLEFNCAYCREFNPARKKRPVGPKFESPVLNASRPSLPSESSNSERNSSSDSDSSSDGPIVEEPLSDSHDNEGSSDVERATETNIQSDKMEVDDSPSHQVTSTVSQEGGDATSKSSANQD